MNTRLSHLRAICEERGVDGFLISSSANIFYLSGFDRFLVDHDGFLLITPKNNYLITSPLYTHAVKKFTPDLPVLETSGDIWYSQMIKKVVTEEKLKVIGFEEHDLRVNEYLDLQEDGVTLKSVSLRSLRSQKDEEEVAKIQEASRLTDETFAHILPFIREGVTEMELATRMQEFLRSKAADMGFPSIVAFGQHSAVPHHMTSDEKLAKNSFILFDFGAGYKKYVSDMSRTVFFGSPSSEQVRLYETVKKSQQAAVAYIEKNIGGDLFGKTVDEVSRKVIADAKFPVYPHALGHGVGLEVHEAPTLSQYSPEKLIDGMVFTIEPGIYVPGAGGVRIEDVYTIQNKKLVQLTQSAKDLMVIS